VIDLDLLQEGSTVGGLGFWVVFGKAAGFANK
jgi:hypothetical protein